MWNPGYLSAAPEFDFKFERAFSLVGLFFAFSLVILVGLATAAALKLEAAVDGNRKEVGDRVASLPGRLGNGEPENDAARASHQPTHPPCYSSTAANGCVVPYSEFAGVGRLYSGENKILLWYQRQWQLTGTKALSARNYRHPPTQPTAWQPANPSYHRTLQTICATTAQKYTSTYQLVRIPANRGDGSVLDFLS